MVLSLRNVLAASLLVMTLTLTVTAGQRRRPYVPGKKEPEQISQPTQETGVPSSDMTDLQRRMSDVETSTSIMKSEMNRAMSENRRLREEVTGMNDTMKQLDVAQKRVAELERLLGEFEKFFGVLYREHPKVFASEMKVETRVTALNEYIGNRKAELMALRPDPPTTKLSPEEDPVDEEMVGMIVRGLGEENERLRRRLDNVENKMASVPAGGRRVLQDVTAVPWNGNEEEYDDLEERVTRLERIVGLALAPLLDGDSEDRGAGQSRGVSNGRGNGRINRREAEVEGTPKPDNTALTESDVEILTEQLNSVRSIASTRKSVFSAASTNHMYGEPTFRVPLYFDQVNVNKGNHFRNNSFFVCEIRGFYFFTFTVRSSDHLFLGVNLMVNGESVTSVFGESDPVQNHMVTQSAALQLNIGDQVWLTMAPSTRFAVYSDHNKYTTFSGFLLFKGS